MHNPYRHTIDELITRYEFEPSIKDLYVEGDTDQAFFDWYGAAKNFDLSVKTIDAVHIPSELIGLTHSGNKGRVIALAKALSARSLLRGHKCIIDLDCDHILGREVSCENLLYTDYSCLEAYFFTPPHLRKFFRLYFRRHLDESILSSFQNVLLELFLLRVVKEKKFPHNSLMNFSKYLVWKSGEMSFDTSGYVKNFCISCGFKNPNAILLDLEEVRKLCNKNEKFYLNGHDLFFLLAWYAKQIGLNPDICRETAISRALYASADIECLDQETLFVSLRDWVACKANTN